MTFIRVENNQHQASIVILLYLLPFMLTHVFLDYYTFGCEVNLMINKLIKYSPKLNHTRNRGFLRGFIKCIAYLMQNSILLLLNISPYRTNDAVFRIGVYIVSKTVIATPG